MARFGKSRKPTSALSATSMSKPAACLVQFGERRLAVMLSPDQCAAFPPGKFLGAGKYAGAYQRKGKPNQVVKFTFDPLDARAAAHIKAENSPDTLKVLDVRRLRNIETNIDVFNPSDLAFEDKDVSGYAIEVERVHPLDWKEQLFVDMAVQANYQGWAESNISSVHTGFMFNLPKKIRDKAASYCANIRDRKGKLPTQAAQDSCVKTANDALDAITAVAKVGILPLDVHGGNFGRRLSDKKMVVIDFGVSQPREAYESIKSLAGNRLKRRRKR